MCGHKLLLPAALFCSSMPHTDTRMLDTVFLVQTPCGGGLRAAEATLTRPSPSHAPSKHCASLQQLQQSRQQVVPGVCSLCGSEMNEGTRSSPSGQLSSVKKTCTQTKGSSRTSDLLPRDGAQETLAGGGQVSGQLWLENQEDGPGVVA